MTPPFVDRLSSWVKAVGERLKRRSWKAWAIVALLVFVVLEAVRARVSDASTYIVEYAWRWFLNLLAQPMGLGGLAVLAFTLALVTLSWLETRPKRAPVAPSQAPLSEGERNAVQQIRTIWHRHGTHAVGQLTSILRDTHHDLKQREFWAELLEPVISSSESSRTAFESCLETSRHSPLRAVRERFNAMYSDYARTMKWVAVLQARSTLALGSRGSERLAVWRQNHRDFIERLRDLNVDPAHSGTLAYSLSFISEPAFREFVLESEMSPEWLGIIRESQGERPPADG